jgi:hypothetical protein
MNESLGVIDHVLVGLIAWMVLSVPVAVGAARFIAVGNRPDEAHHVPPADRQHLRKAA